MANVTKVIAKVGTDELPRTFKGRVADTLHRLVKAGEHGVTPIEYPAPRWSDYVFKLRRQGVSIETIDERHGGPFSGTHARYVLRAPVEILTVESRP